jgi:hypothetical protein
MHRLHDLVIGSVNQFSDDANALARHAVVEVRHQ